METGATRQILSLVAKEELAVRLRGCSHQADRSHISVHSLLMANSWTAAAAAAVELFDPLTLLLSHEHNFLPHKLLADLPPKGTVEGEAPAIPIKL